MAADIYARWSNSSNAIPVVAPSFREIVINFGRNHNIAALKNLHFMFIQFQEACGDAYQFLLNEKPRNIHRWALEHEKDDFMINVKALAQSLLYVARKTFNADDDFIETLVHAIQDAFWFQPTALVLCYTEDLT